MSKITLRTTSPMMNESAIVDISGITHDTLAVLAAKYLKKHKVCSLCFVRNQLAYLQEKPDVIGYALTYDRVIIVEVKVSRGDFLKDKKKWARHPNHPETGLGNYRYYCCPDELIAPDEVMDGWGLLYYQNRKIVEIKRPTVFPQHNNLGERYVLLYYLKYPAVYHKNII